MGIFSRKEEKILKKEKIFNGKFMYMGLEGESIYCSSFRGEIACLAPNGSIVWKQKLGDRPIHNITMREKRLNIITRTKKIYVLDPKTGSIEQEREIKIDPPGSFSSNVTYFKNWGIVSGEGIILYISPSGKKFSVDHGSLIRVVEQHPKGFLTGDDDGNIKLWGYLNVELFQKHKKSFLTF